MKILIVITTLLSISSLGIFILVKTQVDKTLVGNITTSSIPIISSSSTSSIEILKTENFEVKDIFDTSNTFHQMQNILKLKYIGNTPITQTTSTDKKGYQKLSIKFLDSELTFQVRDNSLEIKNIDKIQTTQVYGDILRFLVKKDSTSSLYQYVNTVYDGINSCYKITSPCYFPAVNFDKETNDSWNIFLTYKGDGSDISINQNLKFADSIIQSGELSTNVKGYYRGDRYMDHDGKMKTDPNNFRFEICDSTKEIDAGYGYEPCDTFLVSKIDAMNFPILTTSNIGKLMLLNGNIYTYIEGFPIDYKFHKINSIELTK